MEEKRTIFDYMTQVFCIFGISVMILMVLSQFYNESAGEYSSIFRLGKEGLSIATMLEFFMVSVALVLIRFLFMTDTIFKKMTLVVRTILMFVSIIAVVIGFIIEFEWFPVDMWEPWVMFFVFFGIGSTLGTIIGGFQEKKENQRLQDGLLRLQEQLEGRKEDE